MREVVAEMRNPVMLYSIGKDSSVMLHVAMKAFYPAKPPFPLLHVDTTWKFREMIAFRDETARRLGLELIVHINKDGVRRGISPIASGSQVHTHVMKTEALRQALEKGATTQPSAGRGATRKKAAPRSGSSRIAPPRTPGIRAISARNCGGCFNTRIREGELIQLDEMWSFVFSKENQRWNRFIRLYFWTQFTQSKGKSLICRPKRHM